VSESALYVIIKKTAFICPIALHTLILKRALVRFWMRIIRYY